MKPKRFFFHYNKPESRKQGRNVITLHWNDTCHLIHKIVSDTGFESHDQKRQPRCIMRGWANNVYFTRRGDKTIAHVSLRPTE